MCFFSHPPPHPHPRRWLVFSDPGFQGMVAVLEAGTYPYPESWGFQSPFVGSLRPLKMVCAVFFFFSSSSSLVAYETFMYFF